MIHRSHYYNADPLILYLLVPILLTVRWKPADEGLSLEIMELNFRIIAFFISSGVVKKVSAFRNPHNLSKTNIFIYLLFALS